MKKLLVFLTGIILSSCAIEYVPVSYSPTKIVKHHEIYEITYTSPMTRNEYVTRLDKKDYLELTEYNDIFDTKIYMMENVRVILD